MAITREQIFAAADDLDAAGQNPTLALVRKAIGGGSYTTISDAMNEWKACKAAQAAPLRDPAPQAVTDRLAELGADLWGVALELANNRLAAERDALEAARVEMEADRQEAAELADQLTAELDETKSRLGEMEEAAEAIKVEVQVGHERLAAAGERAATAEARAGELRTELDHAHREVAEARAELAGVRKAHADEVVVLRAELAVVQSRVEAVTGELATAKARVEAQEAAQLEQYKAFEREAELQAGRLMKAQGERDLARDDSGKAREEAALLRGQLVAIKDQNTQLMQFIQEAKKATQAVEQANKAAGRDSLNDEKTDKSDT